MNTCRVIWSGSCRTTVTQQQLKVAEKEDFQRITRDQIDTFHFVWPLETRKSVLSSSHVPSVCPPVRLLCVSLNPRIHEVCSWSKGQPHWPQTLQTHQMRCHVISIASSPYCLTSPPQLQIRPDRTRWVGETERGGRMPEISLSTSFFQGLTSNASVIHFTTGLVLESDFELSPSTMAK